MCFVYDVKKTTVGLTRDHRKPTEGPEAFVRASAGVGTTRRPLGRFFLFQDFYFAAYDF